MAPVPIEDMIKVQMKDIVSNCMVLGDKRKHLACILTLRTVLDSANLPTDQVNMDCISLNTEHILKYAEVSMHERSLWFLLVVKKLLISISAAS